MANMYSTIQGDTWDQIAYKHYGHEFRIPALLDANPAYIDMVIFPSGILLVIPELSEGYVEDRDTAPWRKP